VDEFVIARNPEEGSSLPYLLRLPLGARGVVLKARETWPRTSKVYCHEAIEWPDSGLEIVERVAVRSCVRRGAAIDLVLDRARENRSQFVFARARGRQVIFWQSARTSRQARPNVSLPTQRSFGQRLDVIVDSGERYAWKFSQQQATTTRRRLAVGDYAVEVDGTLVAIVERKSLPDLVSTLTTGKLRYQLAELATAPRAAVVVEDRYSSVFKLEHVRPAVVAEGLAEAHVRVPSVPIMFCETRALAQEWTYRFLGAAVAHHFADRAAGELADTLPLAGPVPPREPTTADVRVWAREAGLDVPDRGRLRPEVWTAYQRAHHAR
jgi:hypothetical protein